MWLVSEECECEGVKMVASVLGNVGGKEEREDGG